MSLLNDEARHTEMLKRAVALSEKALEDPSRFKPFGCVIVRDEDGEIIGESVNNQLESCDPSAHGEVSDRNTLCALNSHDYFRIFGSILLQHTLKVCQRKSLIDH